MRISDAVKAGRGKGETPRRRQSEGSGHKWLEEAEGIGECR